MTNDNRVPAGVPTGGEFATGAKTENDDLTTAPDRDAQVKDILSTYADNGEFRIAALVELDGITATLERKPQEDRRVAGFFDQAWSVTLHNPRTGADYETLQHYSMGQATRNDPAQVIHRFTGISQVVDKWDTLEQYAEIYSYNLADPEEHEEAETLFVTEQDIRDRLRTFLGDDYDSYVHGNR